MRELARKDRKTKKKLLSPSFRWNANSSTSIQQQHRARPHCGRDEAAKAQAGAKPFSGLWRFLKWQLEALGALHRSPGDGSDFGGGSLSFEDARCRLSLVGGIVHLDSKDLSVGLQHKAGFGVLEYV